MKKRKCRFLWAASVVPKSKDMDGDFTVRILTGPCKILNSVYSNWDKTIANSKGSNIINGNPIGCFVVTAFPPMGMSIGELYFNYALSYNPNMWSKMMDTIRLYKPGVFIGKFYLKVSAKPYKIFNRVVIPEYKFLGFFSLIEKGLAFDEKTFTVIEPKVEYYPQEV